MDLVQRRIDDEAVGEHAALVRGLVVQRLEQIWSTCQPHVDGTVEEQGFRPDPRFIEAGIRVLDRLSKLYRLDSPQRTDPESNQGINDPAGLVAAQLRELEARVKGREPS
jgi:hypothetical protein